MEINMKTTKASLAEPRGIYFEVSWFLKSQYYFNNLMHHLNWDIFYFFLIHRQGYIDINLQKSVTAFTTVNIN